jgi:Ca2+-binding RTX toxin-like protein
VNLTGVALQGINSITGIESIRNFTSGAGNDVLTATSNENRNLFGGLGNDQITSGGGSDTIDGAGGNDTLTGGAGIDFLYGGDGEDQLFGGLGLFSWGQWC